MRTKWANCAAPIIRLPISTLGEKEAVLMENWEIFNVRDYRFVVPAGTSTDGASIPRFLWRVCGHPLMAPRVYAAMLHDWLYTGEETDTDGAQPDDLTRAEADECYYALLRHFGVSAWRAKVEYWALRMFGGSHYIE